VLCTRPAAPMAGPMSELRERQREATERLCAKSPKGKPVEPREINLTASFRSGPEYSFYPHPKVECKKKAVDLPGPGKYYRAEQDEKEKSKASFSMGPSINDLGGCPVELMHCSHCDKKTWETWTPPLDAKGKRPRPKECATKGCAYLAAENRSYCCCSCSKVTPAPGFMPPPPIRCAPRPEAKTKSRKVLQCWQPGPAQYNLKSTLEGVDVKGRGWIKPEKKEDKKPKDKKEKEPLGPGHFEPRYSFTSTSAPSIGFGSGSRWNEPKVKKKGEGKERPPSPSSPGPGAYNISSSTGNKMKTPMSVTIKGPWADRDRERNREEATDKTDVEEVLAPIGPGPPITTFKSKRFS